MKPASTHILKSLTRPALNSTRNIVPINQRFSSTAATMTSGVFKYMDTESFDKTATVHPSKAWAKVDGPGWSFKLKDYDFNVNNIRGRESEFSTDISGFSVYHSPANEKAFTDEAAVRNGYYPEVEALLRKQLPGIKKVVFFDHTIRKHDPSSARQPVQQVHVDQTPAAAAARVRRHLPSEEAEELLKGRYQIINVWRPISHPATDFPLAVIDWRTASPDDFVRVDLLYPDRAPKQKADTESSSSNVSNASEDSDDDRGKEVLPDPSNTFSTVGYSVKGETFGILPSQQHKFWYMKDMTPDEAMFIKCFDSRSEWMGHKDWASQVGEDGSNGRKGIAHGTPHTAFIDPQTPEGTKGRESIEVRALVFYE
jgi:hypothetical protein